MPQALERKCDRGKRAGKDRSRDPGFRMQEVIRQQGRRKGHERYEQQQQAVPVQERMIGSLDKGEDTVMIYPLGEYRNETGYKGKVMRPQLYQSCAEAAA